METPALRLKDLCFRYSEQGKRNILDHVSLDIPAGKITVLMGSGGCGKSTLAAVAAGLYPENGGFLASGSVELFGQELSGLSIPERARLLSLMFQNPELQFCMDTLRKELRFCLENLNVPPEEMDGRALAAAQALGLEEKLDQSLYSLSGGEKQRAMLCCLYVLESRCLILDEALANIDGASARELVSEMVRLRREGKTVIAIDHRLDYWLDWADEIVVLGQGAKVLARGINKNNLADFQALFAQEGLYYPKTPAFKAAALPEPEPAVELKGVSVPRSVEKDRWGRKTVTGWLLREADAVFPRGRMTAVVGKSGSGKTSTFLSVLKQHPYEGDILIRGRDLRGIREKELFGLIGMVFQNPGNQFVSQKAEDELLRSLRLWEKGLSEEAAREKALALLDSFGLKPWHRFSPYMLSQGQQRRLAVLAVLAGKQEILFLDEPTYGQDRRSTDAIMERLRIKVETEGLTVVFITHDRELAAAWADKLYRLEGQKLIETRPEALFGEEMAL